MQLRTLRSTPSSRDARRMNGRPWWSMLAAVALAAGPPVLAACGAQPPPPSRAPAVATPRADGAAAVARASADYADCSAVAFERWLDHRTAAVSVCGISRHYSWSSGEWYELSETRSILATPPAPEVDPNVRSAIAAAAAEYWCPEASISVATLGMYGGVWLDVCGTYRFYRPLGGAMVEEREPEGARPMDPSAAPAAEARPDASPPRHERAPQPHATPHRAPHAEPAPARTGVPHCVRGCPCGRSCIPCSHRCRH